MDSTLRSPAVVRAIGHLDRLPGVGDFGHQVVLGPFEITTEAMRPDFSPQGLTLDAGYIYSQFRDEDDNIYTFLRKVAGYWTGPLVMRSNASGGQIEMLSQMFDSYTGALEVDWDADRIRWRSPEALPDVKHPFSFSTTTEKASWVEGDLLEIDGRMLRPGMQWYCPNPRYPGLYALHVYQAEGTILGRKVKGWFGYDFIYFLPGVPWQKGPYPGRLETAYHTLANEYDDGTVEIGMICYGLEGWTFAILSDGETLTHCAREVDVQIVRKPNGYPHEILFSFDDVEYHWRADPRGELSTVKGFSGSTDVYRGAEGHCQRVGDPRTIVNGQGWIDFFQDERVEGKLVERIEFAKT